MGYDKSKVDWTEAEHGAAENADKIYETLRPALADGLQAHDTAAGLAVAKPSYELWAYLVGNAEGKADFGRKLIALGVMLERDNRFLG
ncbi:MAG: hypothetical protein ACREIS_06355 [Nitrospiraceae bacterium]